MVDLESFVELRCNDPLIILIKLCVFRSIGFINSQRDMEAAIPRRKNYCSILIRELNKTDRISLEPFPQWKLFRILVLAIPLINYDDSAKDFVPQMLGEIE